MRRLLKIIYTISFCVLFSLNTHAESVLPFPGERCRIAPITEINKFVNSLNVNILGYGDLNEDEGKLIIVMDKSHDRMYALNTSGPKNKTLFCLIFGGREIDLVAAEIFEVTKKKWGKRKNRYHIPLSKRTLGGSIPYTPDNMKMDDAILALTAYAAQPEHYNAYDEILEFNIKEKKYKKSRGMLMEFANDHISRMDAGEIELVNKDRSDYQQILEAVDHGMHTMLLLVDKKDNDFIFISINREKKKLYTVISGKNFVLLEK